jgi:hypothetical protein
MVQRLEFLRVEIKHTVTRRPSGRHLHRVRTGVSRADTDDLSPQSSRDAASNTLTAMLRMQEIRANLNRERSAICRHCAWSSGKQPSEPSTVSYAMPRMLFFSSTFVSIGPRRRDADT